MSYPLKYTRQFDFQAYQNANPTRPLPGDKVNADYNQVEESVDQIVEFLKGFTRSDGAIANESVGRDQLSADILALIDAANGNEIPASEVTFTPTGGIAATTVQTAIAELDTEKQPIDATLTAWAAVTFAADKLGYATGADAFATTDFTSFARTLVDDANAGAARTTLGLVIGTDVQAFDAELTALAGLTSAADKLPYFTGAGTAAVADFTAFGRSLVDDAAASNARTTLGVVIGTDVQAFDATLLSIAALGTAADKIAYTTGIDTWAETAITAFGRSLIDDAAASNARTTLGLVLGTDVQAFDATLASIAALGTAADKIAYTTGIDTWAETAITAFGRSLIDDAAASNARTTLGLVIGTNVQAWDANLDQIAGLTYAQGDIIYFNGTVLTNLGPGTSGQFLKTQGAAANPIWATIGGGGDMLAANNLSDVASVSTSRTNLGVGTGDSPQFTGVNVGHASDTTIARASAGVISVEGSNVLMASNLGLQTIWIPANAMISRTTNGAAAGSVEKATNKNMFVTKDFDTTTQEFVQFSIRMPVSWDEGTVTFAPIWSHPAAVTNFGVAFGLAGVAISNDDAGDVAFGTAQTSVDTGGTTDDIYEGPTSSAITIAGTPAAGDWVMFQIDRTVADAGDTLAVDARLHGIALFYTINALKDG